MTTDTAGDGGAAKDWLALPRALVSPVYDILGFSITDGGEGWVECTLVVRNELLNGEGAFHGGVWMVVSDSAQGGAVRTMITPEERTATVQATSVGFGGSRASGSAVSVASCAAGARRGIRAWSVSMPQDASWPRGRPRSWSCRASRAGVHENVTDVIVLTD